MPVAYICSTTTAKAATLIRPMALLIMLQPSHRKFCFPCKTPQNIGIQSESNTITSVIHKPDRAGMCQRARMLPCNASTITDAASHTAVCPTQPSGSRRRAPASPIRGQRLGGLLRHEPCPREWLAAR